MNKNPDLTSFASLLGNSFESKINLLSQILKSSHFPSIGKYKENLLINVIKEYIPKKYEVATDFVLFVQEATEERKLKKGFDPLNMGSYVVSKQCDIIIYDSSTITVIFKDSDFVIVRPESVKAIIEVKSNANKKEVNNILDGCLDFALKWQKTRKFYERHQNVILKKPFLFAMCWDISKNKKGNTLTNGKRIREQVIKFYNDNVDKNDLISFPILDSLYCYNECIISHMADTSNNDIFQGWGTKVGKFIRYDEHNIPYYGGDSTISKLLASIHYSLGEDFNRFYSYHDETRELNVLNYRYDGFSIWLTDKKQIKALNSDNLL